MEVSPGTVGDSWPRKVQICPSANATTQSQTGEGSVALDGKWGPRRFVARFGLWGGDSFCVIHGLIIYDSFCIFCVINGSYFEKIVISEGLMIN